MGRVRLWQIRELGSRVAGQFRRRRSESELEEEVRSHLKMLVEENILRGASRDEAEREARRALGGIDRTKEAYRDQRGIPLVDALGQDLRYGVRQLLRSPGFAATALLTLALGIGANTTVFSLIYGLMLRDLPVPHPEQLVRYRLSPLPNHPLYSPWSEFALEDFGVLSGPMMESIRRNQNACIGVFGWHPCDVSFSQLGESKFIAGALVSGSAFSILGIKPELGRLLDESDDLPGGGAGGWAGDISDSFWRNEFHSDPAIVDRTILLNDIPVKIVGVLPRGFEGVRIGEPADVVLPIEIDTLFAAVRGRPSVRQNYYFSQITVMGRLSAGIAIEQARANAASIQETMWDDAMPGLLRQNLFVTSQFLDVTSASTGWSYYRKAYEKPLLIVQGLVGVILILIIANLSGLLLARTASRRHELEIRGALGASRPRLVRQLLTENALLAAIGIPLGCLFAWRASRFVAGLLASNGTSLGLNAWSAWEVLIFAAASGLFTAIVAGILPSLSVTRPLRALTLQAGVRQSHSSGRTTLGRLLIPIQIALSLILVAVAGLFVASLSRLLYTSTGMREEGVFMVRTNLERSSEKGEQLDALYLRMLDCLRAQPGVQSASLVLHEPMTDSGEGSHFISHERSGAVHEDNFEHAAVNAVGPGFFETVGIRAIAGRDFAETDTSSSPGVCILSQSAARFFFPSRSPIGGRIDAPEGVARLKAASYTVVGVVGDAKYDTLHEDPPPTVYLPFTQEAEQLSPGGGTLSPYLDMSFVIRGADRKSIVSAYKETLHRFAPDSPTFDLVSLREKMLQTISSDRLIASLSGFLGLLALVLTCISLYGQVAWRVTERTSEIGIRMALGATRGKIIQMIVGGLAISTIVGVITGLGGAIAVTRILKSLVYNTRPASPALVLGSVCSILLVAVIAPFLPARRAASVDPMRSLRAE